MSPLSKCNRSSYCKKKRMCVTWPHVRNAPSTLPPGGIAQGNIKWDALKSEGTFIEDSLCEGVPQISEVISDKDARQRTALGLVPSISDCANEPQPSSNTSSALCTKNFSSKDSGVSPSSSRSLSNYSEPVMVRTARSGLKLLHEGYAYNVCRERKDRTYFRCVQRKLCPGRLVKNGDNLSITIPHSHPGDLAYTDSIRLRAAFKEHARTSSAEATAILDALTAGIPEEVKVALPSRESMLKCIKRTRKSEIKSESIPLSEFVTDKMTPPPKGRDVYGKR